VRIKELCRLQNEPVSKTRWTNCNRAIELTTRVVMIYLPMLYIVLSTNAAIRIAGRWRAYCKSRSETSPIHRLLVLWPTLCRHVTHIAHFPSAHSRPVAPSISMRDHLQELSMSRRMAELNMCEFTIWISKVDPVLMERSLIRGGLGCSPWAEFSCIVLIMTAVPSWNVFLDVMRMS
jgi:hypothetical protein